MTQLGGYTILDLPLTTAVAEGQPEIIAGAWSRISVLRAVDAAGTIKPDVLIHAKPAPDAAAVPLSYRDGMTAPGARAWRLHWAAQPGITVTLGFSADPNLIDFDGDPPGKLAVPASVLETLNGQSFIGGAVQGQVASQYSHIQLLNPASSGVRVIADYVWLGESSGSANQIDFRTYATALTTNESTLTNKLLSGSSPAAQIRKQTNASKLGSSFGHFLVETQRHPLDPPLVLDEGEGVLLVANTTNNNLIAGFQWREQPLS